MGIIEDITNIDEKKSDKYNEGFHIIEKLSHINSDDRVRMIDVTEKKSNDREAIACGSIYMKLSTLEKINDGEIVKGNVFSVSQVAGIMGAKKTSELIPMCYSTFMGACDITFNIDYEKSKIDIIATAKTSNETGIEMEALTAVSIAALTIYDMCKNVDKSMIISDIKLLRKIEGKSGEFIRT